MAYLTTSTTILPLLPLLPQTSTSAGYSTTVSMLSSHVARAESIINSKIGSRYAITGFTTTAVPPILRMLTEDIASYFVMRSNFSGDNQNVSEWTEKFQEATAMLEAIREGEADIVDTSGALFAQSTTTGKVESTTEDLNPTFSENDSPTWTIDTDKFAV